MATSLGPNLEISGPTVGRAHKEPIPIDNSNRPNCASSRFMPIFTNGTIGAQAASIAPKTPKDN